MTRCNRCNNEFNNYFNGTYWCTYCGKQFLVDENLFKEKDKKEKKQYK